MMCSALSDLSKHTALDYEILSLYRFYAYVGRSSQRDAVPCGKLFCIGIATEPGRLPTHLGYDGIPANIVSPSHYMLRRLSNYHKTYFICRHHTFPPAVEVAYLSAPSSIKSITPDQIAPHSDLSPKQGAQPVDGE